MRGRRWWSDGVLTFQWNEIWWSDGFVGYWRWCYICWRRYHLAINSLHRLNETVCSILVMPFSKVVDAIVVYFEEITGEHPSLIWIFHRCTCEHFFLKDLMLQLHVVLASNINFMWIWLISAKKPKMWTGYANILSIVQLMRRKPMWSLFLIERGASNDLGGARTLSAPNWWITTTSSAQCGFSQTTVQRTKTRSQCPWGFDVSHLVFSHV